MRGSYNYVEGYPICIQKFLIDLGLDTEFKGFAFFCYGINWLHHTPLKDNDAYVRHYLYAEIAREFKTNTSTAERLMRYLLDAAHEFKSVSH